ncbi:MAG: hypothetical protein AAF573_12925, partial [Bacteroidota bacterium]
ITLVLVLFCSFSLSAKVEYSLNIKDYDSFEEWLYNVYQVRLKHPEKAAQAFDHAYDHFLEKKDTLSAVNVLVEIAINYGHQVQYQNAYDKLWKALSLADQAQSDVAKIPVYIQLGRYYSFYKRKEKAMEYLNLALSLSKRLLQEGAVQDSNLARCYYAMCSTTRELYDPIKAKPYLDSCYMYSNISQQSDHYNYLKVEEAFIQKAEGKTQKGLNTLRSIQPWFKKNSPSFMVLLFTYIGDFYLDMNDMPAAEAHYLKATNTAEEYKSHLDFIPTIHERLSNLYSQKGNYQKAFTYLNKEKQLDAQYFDSRSDNNRSLLEIKDDFELEKEKQRQLIQEQRIAALEHEERVNFLENIILLVAIAFLIFAGFLYVNYIRKKHKVEKDLIKKKRELELQQAHELRELEMQKANELLELKNKELATSSLKLIEKDEILATLKERLSKGNGDIKANDLKKIVRSISHSNAQNWEEFEARFMSVNKNFYEKLNFKFPKLSRGDQKLCALVKLNLSSKEMAKLLGISVESVHTNRYRLRKKLGLVREVSLTEFVAKL